jgi:hypothetical protein
MIVVSLTVVFNLSRNKYGPDFADNWIKLPITILSSFSILVLAYGIIKDDKKSEDGSIKEMMMMNHQMIFNHTEKMPFKHPELNTIYKQVYGKANGNTYYTRQEWNEMFPEIKYYNYDQHANEWHYVSALLQQLVTMYNLGFLQKKTKQSNRWIKYFRLWFSHPLTVNVWENHKNILGDCDFLSWTKNNIIKPIQNNPNYWKKSNNN